MLKFEQSGLRKGFDSSEIFHESIPPDTFLQEAQEFHFLVQLAILLVMTSIPLSFNKIAPYKEYTPTHVASEGCTAWASAPFSQPMSKRSRERCATVFDEDTYIVSIEHIIKHNFFPDIPKLRDRIDWLEAICSDDPIIIPPCCCKDFGADPHPRLFSALLHLDPPPLIHQATYDPSGASKVDPLDDIDPLDDFLRWYTSEDNENFSKIMEKVNRKK
ncbi:protein DGCR14 [Canna indica]|uniref:Protein DGCR14 n=1 Tax=Canna indica TaxID=4628 RepID=A0AAQ3Q9H6_9LILI|nr:protein DGCR14 [Canna indica]